jgi:2-keto-3-deoxy-L-rhamnonate aldolase RhmA
MSFKPFLRPNKVLAALERGETPLGMQMYTHDPDLIEVVGYAGFDYVMIDMEHNRCNPETMVHLIRAAEVSGLTPLVRVGALDRFLIRSAVESGAQGIVVPHVKTAEEAKAGMEACHYPPDGNCGICPAIRASGYSQGNWEEYMATSNEQIMFIALLEDVEAIDNAEEIISVLKPGRDGVGIGGADISNSLLKEAGEKVQWGHPYLREAGQKVKALCQAKNIHIMGMAFPTSDKAGVEAAKANGTNIVLFYPDSHIFFEACQKIMKDVRASEPAEQ